MPVQQISLFDFAEEAAPKQAEKKVSQPVNDFVVDETPVDLTTLEPEEVSAVEAVDDVNEEKILPHVVPGTGRKIGRGRFKASELDVVAELVQVPADDVLFSKNYYAISEVADMFKVNISLIRFWENEFSILKPKKNGKGDRLFRPEDIKNLKMIHHLLRERKYTIDGAKEFLKNNKKAEVNFEAVENLKKVKAFLNELKATL